MKKVIKNVAKVTALLVLVVNLSACSDDDVINIGPTNPMEVSIGFGLELSPQSDFTAKNTINHNYELTGYDVVITGGIAGGQQTFNGVDLTQTLQVEVLGEIQITVSHPMFNGAVLDTRAFYGVQGYSLIPVEVNTVNLNLQQGFVIVTVDDTINHVIESVKINSIDKTNEIGTVFYTAHDEVEVEVEFTGGELKGGHSNVIGSGVHYKVVANNGGIDFTYPVFGDPGDGIWFPN